MTHRESDWQLVFFTILTQMAVGAFVFWGLSALIVTTPNPLSEGLYPTVLLAVVVGLLAFGTISAGLHMGRPIHAVFTISNLQSSWLSREALLGSIFGLVVLTLFIRRWSDAPYIVLDVLLILTGMIFGLVLVYGISRLYMLRTVPAWNNPGTPATFFITTFLLGAVSVAALGFLWISWGGNYNIDTGVNRLVVLTPVLILLFSGSQLAVFFFVALYLNSQGGVAAESIRLLWMNLRAILIWRSVLALFGVSILVIQLLIWLPPLISFLALGLILVSEIFGRFLFYGFYQREGF